MTMIFLYIIIIKCLLSNKLFFPPHFVSETVLTKTQPLFPTTKYSIFFHQSLFTVLCFVQIVFPYSFYQICYLSLVMNADFTQ